MLCGQRGGQGTQVGRICFEEVMLLDCWERAGNQGTKLTRG